MRVLRGSTSLKEPRTTDRLSKCNQMLTFRRGSNRVAVLHLSGANQTSRPMIKIGFKIRLLARVPVPLATVYDLRAPQISERNVVLVNRSSDYPSASPSTHKCIAGNGVMIHA